MKKYLLLFILFVIPITLAEEQIDNYNDYSSLTLDFNVHSEIEADSENNPELEYLKTELMLVPREDERQRTISKKITSTPNSEIREENTILFTWREYNNIYRFQIDSRVETQNKLYKIQPQVFPITDLPESVEVYLEPTEFIDINQDIINKAAELVEGETELTGAVFRIADWIKTNIKYDLNTVTAKAVKKSSWVFVNKEGVCDELTNLFISMLRASGIPARFVTGVVYTNTDHEFGNHGWAEVYFPGQGWIPFDLTFGQYAYLDPSHLKLMDDLDSGTASAKYFWKSSNVDINPKDLILETKVTGKGEKFTSPFEININSYEPQVGPGSYVPIAVTIKNPFDSYVSTSLIITKAPELTTSNVKQVLLKPKQEKIVYWIARIDNDLDPNLIYTSYLEVKDTFGNTATGSFEFAYNYRKITEQEAKLIAGSSKEEQKSYSRQLSLICSTLKPYYYNYETASIACSIKNTGNTMINNIEICLETNCQQDSLTIGQKKEKTFNLQLANEKTRQIQITAKNKDIDISTTIPLRVFDKPDLRITFINPPKQLNYKEIYKLDFTLNSQVLVKDLKIKINNALYELNQSQGSQSLKVTIAAKNFYYKPLKIKVEYKDENGNPFTLEKTLNIEVTHIPWYAKLFGALASIFS